MTKRVVTMIAILVAVALLATYPLWSGDMAAPSNATLKVGDAAPGIEVGQWIKGESVTQLEKGKIYVVEFWATWCPPCRESIPHLTELQKQFADKGVICIGSDLGEPEIVVGPFVERMGNKMDYRVAVDKDGFMATHWFKAAGQDGIPCAFLVDRAGKIAWIGHPMDLEGPLAAVVAGKAVQ